MVSVLSELCQWGAKQPYWEQSALERIMSGASFDEADYEQLLQYLLEDAGLKGRSGQRPQLRFQEHVVESADATGQPTKLLRVSNLQDVNALATGQSLAFGPSLTAIFGGNGSGKSGYARVLGCAGFTRGDKEVLPDVTKPESSSSTPCADIELSAGGKIRAVHYEVGSQCPDMTPFYVFDSTSVTAHLTKSNTLSFTPAGLSHLRRLAEVTDQVRLRLQVKIGQCSTVEDPRPLFQGNSDVVRLLTDLGPKTHLAPIRTLAVLSEDDQKRLADLDLQIARLKSQDVAKQLEATAQAVADLEQLADRLDTTGRALSDQVLADINQAVGVHCERQSTARAASLDQFMSEGLAHVGSDEWLVFIEAAKALAVIEGSGDHRYPAPGDLCLLCHQPLSDQARELLLRLWDFLNAEAQARLEESETDLREKQKALSAIDLRFFTEESGAYRHLKEHAGHLVPIVSTFMENCRRRVRDGGSAITSIKPVDSKSLPTTGASEIRQVTKQLAQSRTELEAKDPAEEIARLQSELLNLQHRVLLGEHLSKIENYVQKRAWAQRAAKEGGSTAHITHKYNELFKQLVTDRYVDLLEQTLSELKRPLKVTARTEGRKAEAFKRLVLKDPTGGVLDQAKPEKVLSEGEKRAVALADFLTEVALDESSSGVILDDPVTSLDFEWKETIARRLVQEAARRQVIVFTHDLHFLYVLKKYAEEQQVEVVSHWIKRGDDDERPGYVYLDNSPLLENEYRKADRALKFWEMATKAPPSEQETLLQQGFGALRTSYEAFIMFELLNGVVLRFDERVSFGRLEDVAWDDTMVKSVVEKCELLSCYIEGHLHSDTYLAQKPTPALLKKEIDEFNALKKRLNALKKQKKELLSITLSASVKMQGA